MHAARTSLHGSIFAAWKSTIFTLSVEQCRPSASAFAAVRRADGDCFVWSAVTNGCTSRSTATCGGRKPTGTTGCIGFMNAPPGGVGIVGTPPPGAAGTGAGAGSSGGGLGSGAGPPIGIGVGAGSGAGNSDGVADVPEGNVGGGFGVGTDVP